VATVTVATVAMAPVATAVVVTVLVTVAGKCRRSPPFPSAVVGPWCLATAFFLLTVPLNDDPARPDPEISGHFFFNRL
jgi:hypothetical protein